jgi:formylglycine-generating enzyme required for sulfatase activity
MSNRSPSDADGRAASDSLSAITEANVREALRAMRFAKPLGPSPLLSLHALDEALAAEGVEDSPEIRAWLLQRMLGKEIGLRLARARRVDALPDADLLPPRFAEGMLEDFRAGDIEREAWSMLCLRHVVDDPVANDELSERLAVTKRTLIRRLGRGYALMADALRERELAAMRRRAEARGDREANARGAPTDATPHAADATAPPASAPTTHARSDAGPAAASRASGTPPGPSPDTRLRTLRDAVIAEQPANELPAALLAAVARHSARDLAAQRLQRIATWSAPQYQLDARFVALSLLIDLGETARAGRWQARHERFGRLGEALSALLDPAVVVLGAPGAGKSTLLRRLELETCIDGLRGASDRVTLYASLSGFAGEPGEAPPAPREWLTQLWARRHPQLPSLMTFLAEGRLLLLLDGLNEMPHEGAADYRERVLPWKRFVQESLGGTGNRAVFSCRSLDYSAPLSTPDLRVPQLRIEPLDDEGMRAFVTAYGDPAAWERIQASPHRALLRTPYMLRLLLAALAADDGAATSFDPAALLTAFVRRALRREIERDHHALAPGIVLDERDVRRVVAAQRWRTPYDLPQRGPLIGGLERLAYGMQRDRHAQERTAVQVLYDEALDLIDGVAAEPVVQAGLALAVLDEDRDRDELFFFHQIIQEYFAARGLAESDELSLTRAPWRADEIHPPLEAALAELGAGEPLPPLADTAWSESARMAAAMHADPPAFVAALAEEHLVLAGRAAAQPEVARRLPAPLLDTLRARLVTRSRDPAADLRARFDAGRALGRLGDPRFERHAGAHGAYLAPPLVNIAGGRYTIGDDAPITWEGQDYTGHEPGHRLSIAPFALGRFAVTNAEWACFMAAGGYENEAWWQGEHALAWQRGEGTDEDARANNRTWRDAFTRFPERIDHFLAVGTFDEPTAERWRRWCALDDADFEAELAERWPGGRLVEPRFWRDERLNQPTDPVVGICWYEASAYCAWLTATSGRAYRLPTEVEWEAAARGLEARALPYGNHYAPLAANTVDAHLFGPSPIGVFPEGDTPEGICDLSGNTWDWTHSAVGDINPTSDNAPPPFRYPYVAEDGREDPGLPPHNARVARGGAWNGPPVGGFAVNRNSERQRHRADDVGLRVAAAPEL